MRDSTEWKPTSYRSHTIGQVVKFGKSLVGTEVTISGYAETVRGRGAICFLMLRDGTGRIQAFLKRDNMDDSLFDSIQSASRESTIQVTGIVAEKRAPKVKEGEDPPTPEYEVNVSSGDVLAVALTPLPVGVTDEVQVGLDVRLDNRHLDLRREHVNAMFQLRSRVLQYGREHLISEGFQEINSPKIIAAAAEGGTNLFPMKYFDTDAYLSQSPQLYKQLAVLGGLERVFEIGPAFRAEKHDTYRHLNEFISFDIEGAWMDDEDVMGVQERMIFHIWSEVKKNDQGLIDAVNKYRNSQGKESVVVEVPSLPFPRIPYCEAIEIVKQGGGEIEWGDDIESHHCDLIAAKFPGFHFIPRWPMAMKPFYIHHKEDEKGSSGGQLSRGFDLNFGRDEMTSGGAREHRVDVLEDNLRDMGLDPADFTFYTDGFRYGAPPHAGWGLGVARLLMVLTGAGNVREVVLFPRDRSRVTP
ncbi:MAG TPA: aspartate--tRNA(Asn) ligase [Candidatus Thalassarchaeaceae archaeon]|nr:MAG TPA: aspartate--tRNA(Asn) ligase [Candidatus Poseidoniales archaeon]HII33914.1 aspartate--tRNA(Asn) ligase [Candidatus Thalassarchaeaceae archaeon]|tara:strand:+ start:1813 stop:3222 length:1410 start_codon:yes stop_codon:yes gene_type:complete